MNPTVSQSLNLIPVFAIVVVALVTILREWNIPFFNSLFKSSPYTRLLSIGIGGLLGLLYWFSTTNVEWNFLNQLLNLPIAPIKPLVAVVQGLISGFLGTSGVALVHSFIDRKNDSPAAPDAPTSTPPSGLSGGPTA
jgi:hypothetical protein